MKMKKRPAMHKPKPRVQHSSSVESACETAVMFSKVLRLKPTYIAHEDWTGDESDQSETAEDNRREKSAAARHTHTRTA